MRLGLGVRRQWSWTGSVAATHVTGQKIVEVIRHQSLCVSWLAVSFDADVFEDVWLTFYVGGSDNAPRRSDSLDRDEHPATIRIMLQSVFMAFAPSSCPTRCNQQADAAFEPAESGNRNVLFPSGQLLSMFLSGIVSPEGLTQ